MKVFVADAFDEQGIAALKESGCEVILRTGLAENALADAIRQAQCDVLVVRSTRVTAEMLDASRNLALVVRAGAGFDTIDVAAASSRSVLVANCPGKNAVAVAELTFGLILALDRRIVEGTNDLRGGKWNKKLYSAAAGLKGRKLGVIGAGQVGREVIARAHAFEMPVVAWSRSLDAPTAASLGVTLGASLETVAGACDVMTIHLAATPQTRKLVGANVFERMKTGATLINTSRGDVVDYDALLRAMESWNLRVGLDVYENEPKASAGVFVDRVMQASGIVYGTHHIGASTQQAQDAIAAETVRIIRTFLRTGAVENCVNLRTKSPARYVLLVRHRNRPGVLAHTLHVISHAGVNVEEMENVICEGAEAACARIKIDIRLEDRILTEIETGNENIFSITQSPLGGA